MPDYLTDPIEPGMWYVSEGFRASARGPRPDDPEPDRRDVRIAGPFKTEADAVLAAATLGTPDQTPTAWQA